MFADQINALRDFRGGVIVGRDFTILVLAVIGIGAMFIVVAVIL